MKFLFVILFIFLSSLFSSDFDNLLNQYENASDHSNKTKDESAGNLIVYTRDDLERMQVESLKDILKSLRFFTYAKNRMSQPDIFNSDPLTYYSQTARIYLNDTELLTSLTGSGLILFGDMEMDFIDHVEIYQGFPSFDFGVEPATVVIRLYSKTPEHDEGGRAKVLYGSHGTNKQNVYYSGVEDKYEYFFYANRNDEKQETYDVNGETLAHDKRTERFYGSLKNENHTLQLHVQQITSDALLGSVFDLSGAGVLPSGTGIDSQYINISTDSKFMNDSLTLHMSYINEVDDINFAYSKPVVIAPPPNLTIVDDFDQKINQESFTASLKKNLTLDNHDLTIGAQYRYKYFDVNDYSFSLNGIASPPPPSQKTYDTQNIYSAFIQDEISLNENNLISLSVMNQYYVRNKDADNLSTLQLRLGYTYTNEGFVSKTFVSRQEFAPEPYMSVSPAYGNIDLDPDTYTSIYQELSYTTPEVIYKTVFGGGYNENLPTLDSSGKITNLDSKVDGLFASLELTYKFREKDKLELQASTLYIGNSIDGVDNSNTYVYVARMLNTFGKYDLFNELVVNSGYKDSDNSYNYSLGLRYEATKDLHVSVKGDNIFDDSLEQSYISNIINMDKVNIPSIERRYIISMEYLF